VRFDPEFIQDHFSSAQNYIEFVRDFLEMEGDNTWDKRMCIWYPTDAVRIGDHPMAMFYSFPEKFSLQIYLTLYVNSMKTLQRNRVSRIYIRFHISRT